MSRKDENGVGKRYGGSLENVFRFRSRDSEARRIARFPTTRAFIPVLPDYPLHKQVEITENNRFNKLAYWGAYHRAREQQVAARYDKSFALRRGTHAFLNPAEESLIRGLLGIGAGMGIIALANLPAAVLFGLIAGGVYLTKRVASFFSDLPYSK